MYRLCEITGKYSASQSGGPAGLKGVTYAGWHTAVEDCLVFTDSQGVIKSWRLVSGSARIVKAGSASPGDTGSCRPVAMVPIGRLHGGLPIRKRALLRPDNPYGELFA